MKKLKKLSRPSHRNISTIIFIFFLASNAIVFNILSDSANAAEVTLAWDASSASNLAGYRLYYRQCALNENCTASNADKNSLETIQITESDLSDPSNPIHTVFNLSDIHKYVFALTAYSTSGQESALSNEVNFTPPNAPKDPDPSATTDNSTDDSTDPTTPAASANQPPKVDAGKDQSIDIKLGKAIISGSASDDGLPEGSSMTYGWSQVDGPGTVKFDDPSNPTTAVSFDKIGTYTLKLTASDGQLDAFDTVTATVYQQNEASGDSATEEPSATVDQPIIIDNSDTDNTSSTGPWEVSAGLSPYGENSFYGYSGATFSWHFTCPASGFYNLSAWWTYYKSRSTAVPMSIQSKNGEQTITLNQQQDASEWFDLGAFEFTAGESYEIKITAPTSGSISICADALKFTFLGTEGQETTDTPLIIDNSDKGNTSTTGTWLVSSGKNPYGDNSFYGRSGATFTWSFISPKSGLQDVSIWWTYHSTRSTEVPISITSENDSKIVKVNQQQNASKWASLGQYEFIQGKTYKITLSAPSGSSTVCADAVKITNFTP